jgi:hypothetical protein
VHHNRFIISNDLAGPLTLSIEPEGAFFSLARGEDVSVSDVSTTAPVPINLSNSDKGGPIVSIWPGDGAVKVEQDGVDVLELLQRGVGVLSSRE